MRRFFLPFHASFFAFSIVGAPLEKGPLPLVLLMLMEYLSNGKCMVSAVAEVLRQGLKLFGFRCQADVVAITI